MVDPLNQRKPATKPRPTSTVNPFARALAETEHSLNAPKPAAGNNPFSEALARTGGRMGDSFGDPSSDFASNPHQPSPEELARQQEELARQQKKEAMRKKLHDQVNPVDLRDVFDAKEKRVLEQLEETRNELKKLMQDVAKLSQDLDIETTKVVVSAGQEGKYHISFFQQLRNFIMLLRKRVQSARTWMQQSAAKQAKKKRKGGKQPGLEMAGQQHEQTKTMFDMMHHERSSTYSGN
jgi:hypothetical protein